MAYMHLLNKVSTKILVKIVTVTDTVFKYQNNSNINKKKEYLAWGQELHAFCYLETVAD